MRSDLACEQNPAKSTIVDQNLSVTEVEVDSVISKKIGKPIGKYVTVDSTAVVEMRCSEYKTVSELIYKNIVGLLPKESKKILVVGLGNRGLTADALGCLTCEKVSAQQFDSSANLCLLCPGVFGVTGIESYDVIKGVVNRIKPDAVIVVDSLCAGNAARMGTSFQISNAGIVPGSGVKNSRKELSMNTLGVRVISIGVPMVVFASTIIEQSCSKCRVSSDLSETVVTLKDVDLIVDGCASIIADALNKIAKEGTFNEKS